MQIYFRKLGGATVDTPDLGPVKKLGMGRRTGPVVTPPRAASALPSFGDASLAGEFGSAVGDNSASAMGAMMAASSDGNGAAGPAAPPAAEGSAAGTGTSKNGAAEAANEPEVVGQGFVGGLEVDQTQMDGVAEEELQFLQRRCKRRRQPVTS